MTPLTLDWPDLELPDALMHEVRDLYLLAPSLIARGERDQTAVRRSLDACEQRLRVTLDALPDDAMAPEHRMWLNALVSGLVRNLVVERAGTP